MVGLAAVGLSWTVFLLVHALPGNPFSGSERIAGVAGSVAYAVPNFVWGMWLFFIFSALMYRWTGGLVYVEVGWGQPVQWVLPAVALALPQAGLVARIVRASVLDTMTQDYV